MNTEQRKKITACQLAISQQATILEQIRDENQDSFDNLPEGLQQADKGQEMEQAIEWLSSAIEACEQVDDELSNF